MLPIVTQMELICHHQDETKIQLTTRERSFLCRVNVMVWSRCSKNSSSVETDRKLIFIAIYAYLSGNRVHVPLLFGLVNNLALQIAKVRKTC